MTNILYETPYEKYERTGVENLTDAELLAIILRSGTSETDVLLLANNILSIHDKQQRIIGLQSVTYDELITIKGIGRIKAMCIGALLELSKRLNCQQKSINSRLVSPDIISDLYMEKLRHLKQESVFLLFVDVKCRLIKEMRLSIGTINSSLISVRDVFINALICSASGVIVLHNHPSGDPTPSDADMLITGKLKKASEILDIPLIDHIIIGDKKYYSFKKMGYI